MNTQNIIEKYNVYKNTQKPEKHLLRSKPLQNLSILNQPLQNPPLRVSKSLKTMFAIDSIIIRRRRKLLVLHLK